MNKRVLSLVLALVMVFALPVFATDTTIIGGNEDGVGAGRLIQWTVEDTKGILLEDVEFNVYEKEPGQAEVKLNEEPIQSSDYFADLEENPELPIVRYGEENVAYAYYEGDLKEGATYYVRAEFGTLNAALEGSYDDITRELVFTVVDGVVTPETDVYVLEALTCDFNIQVLGNGFVGKAGETVYAVTFEIEDGQYVLTSREDGYAGNFQTNGDLVLAEVVADDKGYAPFALEATNGVVTINGAEVPAGQLLGFATATENADGELVFTVKNAISVYAPLSNLDYRYNHGSEIPEVDVDVEYVPSLDACPGTLPIYAFTPAANNSATIRVWAMTDVVTLDDVNNTNLTRVPAVGAKIALYENGTENVWDKITKGDLIAEKEINRNGYVDFTGLSEDEVIRFLSPEGANEVSLPYMVEATEMPLGFYNNSRLMEVSVTAEDVDENGIINVFLTIGTDNAAFNRIAGDDRYETALAVARATYPNGLNTVFGAKTVILAAGTSFSDALAGGVLTEAYDAPLLLTRPHELHVDVAKYIADMGVTRVILLGGTNSISSAIENQLTEKYDVLRLAGETRFDTAVAIGEHLINVINDGNHAKFLHGTNTEGLIFVANGVHFADALTASVPAALHGSPLLLTNGTDLTAETRAALEDWNPRKVVVIGGEASVSKALEAEMRTITNVSVERYAGENRATTSMKTAEIFFANSSKAYIASGADNNPDALVATRLAAKDLAPILLVNKDSVPTGVAEYIERSMITEFTILGGPNSVSDAVRVQLAELLK